MKFSLKKVVDPHVQALSFTLFQFFRLKERQINIGRIDLRPGESTSRETPCYHFKNDKYYTHRTNPLKSGRTVILGTKQIDRCFIVFSGALVGSLSNDDSDGNEDGKKARGLDWQNNNFVRGSRCFIHFFAVVARLRRETAGVNTRQRPSFSFPEL